MEIRRAEKALEVKMKNRVVKVLGTILLLLLAFGLGVAYPAGWHGQKTEVYWNTVYQSPVEKEVIKRVPEYIFVDRPEIRVVSVEKVVNKRIEPRPWGTIQEFEAWYKSKLWYMPSWVKQDGIWKRPDCDDWAEMIQEEAIRDGRFVSETDVYAGFIGGKYIPWLGGDANHVGLRISAGNERWYYELYPWDFPKRRVLLGPRD